MGKAGRNPGIKNNGAVSACDDSGSSNYYAGRLESRVGHSSAFRSNIAFNVFEGVARVGRIICPIFFP